MNPNFFYARILTQRSLLVVDLATACLVLCGQANPGYIRVREGRVKLIFTEVAELP